MYDCMKLPDIPRAKLDKKMLKYSRRTKKESIDPFLRMFGKGKRLLQLNISLEEVGFWFLLYLIIDIIILFTVDTVSMLELYMTDISILEKSNDLYTCVTFRRVPSGAGMAPAGLHYITRVHNKRVSSTFPSPVPL